MLFTVCRHNYKVVLYNEHLICVFKAHKRFIGQIHLKSMADTRRFQYLLKILFTWGQMSVTIFYFSFNRWYSNCHLSKSSKESRNLAAVCKQKLINSPVFSSFDLNLFNDNNLHYMWKTLFEGFFNMFKKNFN